MAKSFDDFYFRKRVLITGHTGFKGAWLSMWLHELGAEVIGYALKPPTAPSLFQVCDLDKLISSVTDDIRNLNSLIVIFEQYQPEIVFHLAAQSLVRPSFKAPVETYETNVIGTVNVLEACRQTPTVKAIVNITSDKCYENREWAWGYRENDSLGGFDPYSSSKACSELVTATYLKSFFWNDDHAVQRTSLASARAGNVIGGGDWAEDRLIPDCIKAMHANRSIHIRYPDAVRPWQHVLEPLYGYLLLAQHLYQKGSKYSGAWNFGPDDDLKSVRWLVEHTIQIWDTKATWSTDQNDHPHEAHALKLDCSKAKAEIGWNPQWNLETALKNTIDWYKAYYAKKDMLSLSISQIKNYVRSIQKWK